MLYWTGSTAPIRSLATTKSNSSTMSVTRVQGVNGSREGLTSTPAERSTETASTSSATVWPLSSLASTSSLVDSKADTTNSNPAPASSGQMWRWRRMCSTLVVQSKVSPG